MGAGRGLPRDLAPGPARLRLAGRHRLVLAGGRRSDDEGAARRSQDRSQSHRQSQGGAKRSLLTDAVGIPIGLDHDGANRNDHKLLKGTLDSVPIERPDPSEDDPQGLCLDKAYDFPVVRDLLAEREFTPHIRARGEEIDLKQHNPDWRARRWVVEACHSWLNRNRGVLVRWSKKEENHLAFLQLASGMIAFKRAHAARVAAAL